MKTNGEKRLGALVFFSLFAFLGTANADPITCIAPGCINFSDASQYSNNNPPTGGLSRDIIRPTEINRGSDFGGTGHTALNFTGSANSFGATSLTVFDTNPTNASPTLFTGSQRITADLLFHEFDNARELGIVALFNEGAGHKGLFLGVSDSGNTEFLRLRPIYSDGFHFPSSVNDSLAQVNLSANHITLNQWYQLTFDLTINGDNFTVLGKVFTHSTETDPNSALGSQVSGIDGSTLAYSGSLSGLGLQSTGECGLAMRQQFNEPFNHGSITNYTNCHDQAPEPATVLLLGSGLLGLEVFRRRLKKCGSKSVQPVMTRG